MKLFLLVAAGLEQVAEQEVTELIKVKSKIYPQVLELEANRDQVITLLTRSQTVRRLLVGIPTLDKTFPWLNFFTKETTFKVEVEGVSGQDNRLTLARTTAGKIYPLLEPLGLSPIMELKKPNLLVVIYFNGEQHFYGIDLAGKELNARDYRVFPHQASFKGDAGYFFVRKSRFHPGNKLLVGFSKDGVIAIEAALLTTKNPVRQIKKLALTNFPAFKDLVDPTSLTLPEGIEAFDESQQNVLAAHKNALLAKVKFPIRKMALDEIDVKYNANSLDQIIIHLTTKDEDRLNEIYYQASYALKPKGKLLLITRTNLEVSTPSKFQELEKGEFCRGDSKLAWWLLEKV